MDVISHVRDVMIVLPAGEVVSFLRQVPNLPRWTRFYLRAGEQDGDFHAMETMLGPARTRIHEEAGQDGGRLTIESHFGSRRETAAIEVHGSGQNTNVSFHIRLPAGLPRPRVDGALEQLEGELRTLKRLLEAAEAEAPAGSAP